MYYYVAIFHMLFYVATPITRFVVIYYVSVCELHACHSTLNGLVSSCLVVLIHGHI